MNSGKPDRTADSQAEKFSFARWQTKLRRAAPGLAYDLFPDLAALALEVRAASLRFAGIPELFSRELRQIGPSSNEELLDLYGRSEQILANRFSFFNLGEDFGAEIDWERHPSPGWRAELHAFDYALDLALTYRISREERYARHLRYLVAQWIAANPPGQGSGWTHRPLARRIRNSILAADLARDDWERDSTFLSLVAESLALQATYLTQHIKPDATDSECLDSVRALSLASKFFAGPQAAELAALARTLLDDRQVNRRRLGEGQSPALPSAQLRDAETLMELVHFAPSEDPPSRDRLKLRLLESLRSLEGMLWPDGTLPLFGPCAEPAPEKISNLFALAAVIFEEPRWKSLAGNFGVVPYLLLGENGRACFEGLPGRPWKSECLPGQKNGIPCLAGAGQSRLIVNALPAVPTAGHEDLLSYELSMAGQRVIVDSGAFSPEAEAWNPYFSSALAHNVLLVDGQGPSRLSSNSPAIPSTGTEAQGPDLRLRIESPGFKSLGLDHARAWYCLDGKYWVVFDRLLGWGLHRCTSLVHFYPTFSIELCGDRVLVRSRSLAFTLILLGAARSEMKTFRGDHPDFPGWYSPDFGLKIPSAALHLEWPYHPPSWLGGYVIVPGSEVDFRLHVIDASASIVTFDLFGKPFHLRI